MTSNEESIKNPVSWTNNQTLGVPDSNPEMIIAKMNDPSRHSSNVMVYNLPESSSSNLGIRMTHESDLFSDFSNHLFLHSADKEYKPLGLEKQNSKPRGPSRRSLTLTLKLGISRSLMILQLEQILNLHQYRLAGTGHRRN